MGDDANWPAIDGAHLRPFGMIRMKTRRSLVIAAAVDRGWLPSRSLWNWFMVLFLPLASSGFACSQYFWRLSPMPGARLAFWR